MQQQCVHESAHDPTDLDLLKFMQSDDRLHIHEVQIYCLKLWCNEICGMLESLCQ